MKYMYKNNLRDFISFTSSLYQGLRSRLQVDSIVAYLCSLIRYRQADHTILLLAHDIVAFYKSDIDK
jgi:hypothetical protein